MWEFVLRTFQHLAVQIDPHDHTSSPMYANVVGRASQTKMLTLNETTQMNRMNAIVVYKDDAGIGFIDEIEEVAATLDQLV
jgi:hypothetical protein